mmetsp:Transcript_67641/g.174258  ORF Transcript_67641/g.174258 Transcript_67641/m.174258 type:complete len:223 (+) Transcript_67641:964-1632(+)
MLKALRERGRRLRITLCFWRRAAKLSVGAIRDRPRPRRGARYGARLLATDQFLGLCRGNEGPDIRLDRLDGGDGCLFVGALLEEGGEHQRVLFHLLFQLPDTRIRLHTLALQLGDARLQFADVFLQLAPKPGLQDTRTRLGRGNTHGDLAEDLAPQLRSRRTYPRGKLHLELGIDLADTPREARAERIADFVSVRGGSRGCLQFHADGTLRVVHLVVITRLL